MLNVAVVGLGWWGRHIIGRLAGPNAPFRVAATVDPDPNAGATHRDLDAVLRDGGIDAVVLCTPNTGHAEQALRAASAGKHVLCEKPLALTAADAQAIVEASRRAGVVLGVGHERRFEVAMRETRDRIAAGALGTILHAEAAFSHDKFRDMDGGHWRGSLAEAPAAGMTAMGVHLTDLLIWMLGPVSQVYASVRRRVLPLPTGDVVVAQLEFANGAVASINSLSITPFYGRLAVFGSEGWVELRDDAHPEVGGGTQVVTGGRDGAHVWSARPPVDAVLANLQAFADAIAGAAPYPFTDQELVHNVAVLEAIARSAERGTPVAVG